MTNPCPAQVKITTGKPNDNYASKHQKLTVSDMKAFFGVRFE